jgi:hypothetical protein
LGKRAMRVCCTWRSSADALTNISSHRRSFSVASSRRTSPALRPPFPNARGRAPGAPCGARAGRWSSTGHGRRRLDRLVRRSPAWRAGRRGGVGARRSHRTDCFR